MLSWTQDVWLITVLVFEKQPIILDGIRSNDTYWRCYTSLFSFRSTTWHVTEGQTARIASNGMITSLSHPVGGIELLLTNLRVIVECLVLVCLLGPSHLRLVARHASISLRHAVNVLAVQEVVHDLVAVLVA